MKITKSLRTGSLSITVTAQDGTWARLRVINGGWMSEASSKPMRNLARIMGTWTRDIQRNKPRSTWEHLLRLIEKKLKEIFG